MDQERVFIGSISRLDKKHVRISPPSSSRASGSLSSVNETISSTTTAHSHHHISTNPSIATSTTTVSHSKQTPDTSQLKQKPQDKQERKPSDEEQIGLSFDRWQSRTSTSPTRKALAAAAAGSNSSSPSERLRAWEDLLDKRPPTESHDAISDWIKQIMNVSKKQQA
jgi:hypothetical protein